jgi:hypothetical protein
MGCGASTTNAPTSTNSEAILRIRPASERPEHEAPVETPPVEMPPVETPPVETPPVLARQGSRKKEKEKQLETGPAESPVPLARQASGKKAKEPRKERAKTKDEDTERPVDTSALRALQEASGVLAVMKRSKALMAAAEGRWQEHQQQNEASRARYVEPMAVFDALESGDVAVVSLRWLLMHAASGRPLPRRQDMPKEAHVTAHTLRLWHDAAPEHVRKAVLPLISISYCWLSPEQYELQAPRTSFNPLL